MRSLPFAMLLTGPLLLLFSAAQNPPREPPKPRETPEVRVTPSEGARKEIARTTKAMQGLWILREFEWPHLEGLSSEFRGYCLVSDNHLDFEVHIGLKGPNEKVNDVLLDSGLWRFEVAEANRMNLTALIGSFIDKDNRVAFREAGTQCRYEVLALGEQMVWRKEDGQRLAFDRLLDGAPPRVDVFGRPLPEPKDEDVQEPGAKKAPRKDGG
jgi:hypothetical protein